MMPDKIFLEIHKDLPREGPGRNQYTEKAFNMIPKIENPKILDIGCGPGQQTIHLAKLSNGIITAIDIYDQYLDQLREKIVLNHLEDKIIPVNQSMFNMQFPKESFDIIWAEGSIYLMGFEQGLIAWKDYIKPDGFIAVHEMAWINNNPPQEIVDYWQSIYPAITTIDSNIEIIKKCGFRILGHFPLPEDAWWDLYYTPLEKRLKQLQKKYSSNTEALRTIKAEEQEIELYRRYHHWYGSVFFIMQKT